MFVILLQRCVCLSALDCVNTSRWFLLFSPHSSLISRTSVCLPQAGEAGMFTSGDAAGSLGLNQCNSPNDLHSIQILHHDFRPLRDGGFFLKVIFLFHASQSRERSGQKSPRLEKTTYKKVGVVVTWVVSVIQSHYWTRLLEESCRAIGRVQIELLSG